MTDTNHKANPMASRPTKAVNTRVADRMAHTMPLSYIATQRQPGLMPFARLAQELGYAKEKTARDQLTRPYLQVATTNRVLIAAGYGGKACELMASVDASMVPVVLPLPEAVHRHDTCDALEDVAQADFVRHSSDEALDGWIRRLARDLHNSEVLLACLEAERQRRQESK